MQTESFFGFNLQNIPMENAVLAESSVGKRRFGFMVWPSVGIRVKPDLYNDAVFFCRHASNVYFDGVHVIVPRQDVLLIERVSEAFCASEIVFSIPGDERYDQALGDEFATKAIQLGISPNLVVLGNGVVGIAGTIEEMLEFALNDPTSCRLEWQRLYNQSMNGQ